MTAPGPVGLLARTDKWFLSAGEGLVWAPPFPAWLEAPGFWDEAHLFQYPVAPLFTVAFVDETGREIALGPGERQWTPDVLEARYRTGAGLELVESRMVLPGFVLGSEWQIANIGVAELRLHVVAWTTAPGAEVEPGDVAFAESELSWARVLADRAGHKLTVQLALAMARGTDSWGAVRSELTANQPRFALTPFWDRWDPTAGGLGNRAELAGLSTSGLVYLGVHRVVEITAGEAQRLAVALRAVPEVSMSAARLEQPAARRASSFAAASRASWDAYFESVPSFRCSDPYLERYWAYRWYGLRLSSIAPGWGNYTSPTVAEGIGDSHQPIAYAAPSHVRELRWLKDPEWPRGVLRTFLSSQQRDGSLRGSVPVKDLDEGEPYHADWGGALLALDAVHPSDAFLREVLPALEAYAGWLTSQRDPEGTGLVDVSHPDETGQARAARFQPVEASPDREAQGPAIRLKGVDSSVFAYRLFRALAELAPRAGREDERWGRLAEQTGAAILKKLWDQRGGCFSDLNPVTGRRTGVRSAVSFYPYFTDLVGAPHLSGFVEHLFDPRQFWKPFPVPSASGRDPSYDPDGTWKGKRHGRPWNGRVWPLLNSHVAEAVAHVALDHLPALRAHLVEFITKFVRMMFWDGDASRPNCFEHYHPVTGRPSAYRGLDDCQHSWVNDLIVQYVVGLRPESEGTFLVDPMPFGFDGFEAKGLAFQGASVDVVREGERLLVEVNGREAARGRLGEAIRVRL